MFGVIPSNHAAIAAAPGGGVAPQHINVGYNFADANNRIIYFAVPAPPPALQLAAIESRFQSIFRRIATDPVGRTLLYRILIEIRRRNADTGVCENGININAHLLATRNCNRCISITWDEDNFSFLNGRPAGVALARNGNINFNDNIKALSVVYSRCKLSSCHKVAPCYCQSEVALFHEMLHWFHTLRHSHRKVEETFAYRALPLPPVNLLGSGRKETIGSYFWGELIQNNDDSVKFSSIPWANSRQIDNITQRKARIINFEEIRTILGSPNMIEFRTVVPIDPVLPQVSRFQYFEGDDLSENMFRISIGMPVRLGHVTMTFFEDYKVINRVLNVSNGTTQDLLPEQKGLGNFKIREYNNHVMGDFFAN